MKKSLMWACLAALMLPLVSCNKNNEQQKAKTPATPAAFTQYAQKLVIKDKNNDLAIESIEFTEAGRYLIASRVVTKANDPEELVYTSGTYQVNGNTYNLNGYGTVVVDGSQITITPEGESPVTVEATAVPPMETTELTTSICKVWKVDKVDMNISGGDIREGAAGVMVNGCNLYQIVNQLNSNYGLNVDPEPVKGMEVKCISITHQGTLIIEFTDAAQFQPFVADFELSGNAFEYEFTGNQEGNDIFNSHAKGSVNPKSDGSLWLEITATVESEGKTYQGSVTFVMSEYQGA